MQIERQYKKVINNLQQVDAWGGRIMSTMNEEDSDISELIEEKIYPDGIRDFPLRAERHSPAIAAYHISIRKGHNVDQPRNLAKSVTVE